MKFRVKFYNYIAQETQFRTVDADSRAEAAAIAYALGPDDEYVPENYLVSEYYEPSFVTVDDLDDYDRARFEKALKKAKRWETEE